MLVDYLHHSHGISINRSCALIGIGQSTYYRPVIRYEGDKEIVAALQTLASKHKRWGCDKMAAYLKNTGKPWNHKRIHRIYKQLGLSLRHKPKRHFTKNEPEVLFQPLYPNVCWSIDFMSDALDQGVKIRTLNVIDDFNREGIGIVIAFSMPSIFVTNQLDEWCKARGYPDMIRVDNGPEFISSHFKQWALDRNIKLRYIQPGKPAQNAYIERFNGTYRTEVLDMNKFQSITEAEAITQNWLVEYNTIRPHESLGNLSPIQFANKMDKMRSEKINELG